jgi:hypothetical protein
MDKLWYRWTTWWNPYGDVIRVIVPRDDVERFISKYGKSESLHMLDRCATTDNDSTNKLVTCKGIVRREDSLLFVNTLSCHKCSEFDLDSKNRGNIHDFYFVGQGVGDRTIYTESGRHFI